MRMMHHAVVSLLLAGSAAAVLSQDRSREGEFWKEQALTDLLPHWWKHAGDREHGAFHTSLSREWVPTAPRDKIPAMISRQVYGFSAGYLLSGEDRYLEAARRGVDYLLEHAWDEKYGGWFDSLTLEGEPKSTTKSGPLQLYTDVGLTLYYFVTGDDRVLARLRESLRIRKVNARSEDGDGYVEVLNRDLSVRDGSKRKHSHFGYVGSLLLNYYMVTRDPEALSWAEELMALTLRRMKDERTGWISRGFDQDWNLLPDKLGETEVVSAGVQLTAVLALLRLYELTGKEVYRKEGTALADQTMRYAWDGERGGWRDVIEKAAPHRALVEDVVWWVQCYGSFTQLHLYRIDGDRRHVEGFERGASFWNRHFLDTKYGGTFLSVSSEGAPVDVAKAQPWKTSYHEMEHALLNYLYLTLFVERTPATLHFRVKGGGAERRHFVSLVEDSSVAVSSVASDDGRVVAFDPLQRSVTIPRGAEVKVRVTLAPPPLRAPSREK